MLRFRVFNRSPYRDKKLQPVFCISETSALFFWNRETDYLKKFCNAPMVKIDGRFESLNISVSAAIIIQNLTNRLRNSNIDWHLSETEILEKRL
jgi:tRNA (guanosine-2'-O-)-methyltransferase